MYVLAATPFLETAMKSAEREGDGVFWSKEVGLVGYAAGSRRHVPFM